MAQSSNRKRALRRQECREALARHIYDRLGLRIAPNEVRLQPSPDEGYAWSAADSKANLLKCSLSSGTVGLYEAICTELGRSIEAVHPESLDMSQTPHPAVCSEEDSSRDECDSFTAIIQRLKQENQQLRGEFEQSRDQLNLSMRAVQEWKRKNCRSHREALQWKRSAEKLELELNNVRSVVAEAMHVLEKHEHRQI